MLDYMYAYMSRKHHASLGLHDYVRMQACTCIKFYGYAHKHNACMHTSLIPARIQAKSHVRCLQA